MVNTTLQNTKNSQAEFISLTLTMITLNLYDERYFMTEWNFVFPKYTNKRIVKKNKCQLTRIYCIDKYEFDYIRITSYDSYAKTPNFSIYDFDDYRNKHNFLEDELLKDLKNKNQIKPRFLRKYLFEPHKQKKQIFKRKNFSFQPQRYQIRRNQF